MIYLQYLKQVVPTKLGLYAHCINTKAVLYLKAALFLEKGDTKHNLKPLQKSSSKAAKIE